MADGAPEPVAPFSHAVRAGNWLFVTGQMPTLPGGGQTLVEGGVEAQTDRAMANLGLVLDHAGASLADVVSVRIYLTHFERDYALMNAAYRRHFAPGRLPARTCIGVTGLALGALVEIDMVAWLGRT
ncbi:RidA family protein [Marinivivus vitaminiproducens]|uniref:RidA family protein n=1 Tax=Marinivivus vitaminiproducens TaxID=3035935 RepID=UPI003FA01C04